MKELDIDRIYNQQTPDNVTGIVGMRNILSWSRGSNIFSWLTFHSEYGEACGVDLKVTKLPFIHKVNRNRYFILTDEEVERMVLPRII